MLHRGASALITVALVGELPMQRLAITGFAKVVCEWVRADEANQAVKFSHLDDQIQDW
jgi:predicted ATP-grasp superfamily ATP-dependent carboligase